MPRRRKPADPTFPGVILIDTRESLPWSFRHIPADASQGGGTLAVRTEVRGLKSGDYSLDGFEDLVAVERKSASDLFGTVGQGRDRFVRELERLNAMDFAAVVVEAEWSALYADPPRHSALSPKTVFRSVVAWQQRFPRVHWHFWPTREAAEVVAFRILERFWKERQHDGDRSDAGEHGSGTAGPAAVPAVRVDAAEEG